MAAALWYTDNGRVLCEDHLGATAKYSRRDISGQRIEAVTVNDRLVAAHLGLMLRCETCEVTR